MNKGQHKKRESSKNLSNFNQKKPVFISLIKKLTISLSSHLNKFTLFIVHKFIQFAYQARAGAGATADIKPGFGCEYDDPAAEAPFDDHCCAPPRL